MLFLFLLFLLVALIIGATQFFVVGSRLKSEWRLNAPSVIVGKVKSRNRLIMLVVVVLLLLSLVIEAMLEDYSYWLVDQQMYLIPPPVPEWGLAYSSMGSISWLLYLFLLLGALSGCVYGSWFATRQYSLLRNVKPFSLI